MWDSLFRQLNTWCGAGLVWALTFGLPLAGRAQDAPPVKTFSFSHPAAATPIPDSAGNTTRPGSFRPTQGASEDSNHTNMTGRLSFAAVDALLPPPAEEPRADESNLHPCGRCEGKGAVQQRLPCAECYATGSFRCDECGGEGHHQCGLCGGTRKQICMLCQGSGNMTNLVQAVSSLGAALAGSTVQPQAAPTVCTSCHGSGTRPCKECRGTGRADCPVCHGHGRTDCAACTHGYQVTTNPCPLCAGAKMVADL